MSAIRFEITMCDNMVSPTVLKIGGCPMVSPEMLRERYPKLVELTEQAADELISQVEYSERVKANAERVLRENLALKPGENQKIEPELEPREVLMTQLGYTDMAFEIVKVFYPEMKRDQFWVDEYTLQQIMRIWGGMGDAKKKDGD